MVGTFLKVWVNSTARGEEVKNNS
nr:hypothetical protein LRH_10932 [Lacticaseibacillus rhamnosus HN001]